MDSRQSVEYWCKTQSRLQKCSYKWTIDNFSYRTDAVTTAQFQVPSFARSAAVKDATADHFTLMLNPVGDDGTEMLVQVTGDQGVAVVNIYVLDSNGVKVLLDNDGFEWDRRFTIPRAELLKPSNGYLPEDKLTILCEIGSLTDCKTISGIAEQEYGKMESKLQSSKHNRYY